MAVSIAANSAFTRDSVALRPAVPLRPTTSDARIAMIAMTTSNSISVNPSFRFGRFIDLSFPVPIVRLTTV